MDPGRPLERGWDEHEIVYMFTEILQQANARSYSPSTPQSASQILYDSIQRLNIQPSWEEIVPPTGRSIAQCRGMFQHFGRRSAPPPTASAQALAITAPDGVSRKRPYEAVAPTGTGRVLKPKPIAADPSRFSLPGSSMFPLSPLGGEAPSLAEPGRKKRGRPTKKEQEERRRQDEERRRQAEAEAARRQSMMASPELMTPHSAPFPAGPMAGPSGFGALAPTSTMTPQAQQAQPAEESNSGSSGSRKRRGGRGKNVPPAEPAPPFPLPERTTGYESPPRGASTRDRRTSVSTRSETATRATTGSTAPEGSTAATATPTSEAEERRQTRPRTWNETIGL